MEVSPQELFEALEIVRARRANVQVEDKEEFVDGSICTERTGLKMVSIKDTGESPIDLLRQHPQANEIFENFLASHGIPYSKGVQILNNMQGREREVFLQLLTFDPTK